MTNMLFFSFKLSIIIFHFVSDDILQPSGNLLQPQSLNSLNPSTLNNNNSATSKTTTALGATWTNSGNLNIDLDNLMGNKVNKNPGSSMTMNQLKSINSSPVHQPVLQSPMMSPNSPTMKNFNAASTTNNFTAFQQQPPQQQQQQMPIFGNQFNQTQNNFNNNNQFNAFQ